MTQFPAIALDVRPELLINGAWTDVSTWNDHGPIRIGRGHPDESVTISPSTLELTLTNTDARFTSKNPIGPYYPYLVRNTQLRVSIPSEQPYMRLETDDTSGASCPAVSVTTDLDVRIDAQVTDRGGGELAGSWGGPGLDGWQLALDPGAFPRLYWSTTGTDTPSARATAAIGPGRVTLRATLQLSTGTVTFYTAPGGGADAGPFTQLGAAVVTGATTLHAPAVALRAGTGSYGRVYELELRNGISGTVVAHPVFSSQSAGTTSFADGQSNTWTLNGTAELSARDYRGHFEVPEWPQHQPPADPGGTQPRNVLVVAKGGGLLRRLSQRNSAVQSALRRAIIRSAVPAVAYIPMEDGAGAQSLASGISGPAAKFSGVPQLASNSDFPCSAALPVLNGTVIVVPVPGYSGTWTDNQVTWLMEVPSGGEFNGAEVLRVATGGTIAQAVITYGTTGTGTLTVTFLSASGSTLATSTWTPTFSLDGTPALFALQLFPDGGGGVNWVIEGLPVGTAISNSTSGNVASASIANATSVTFNAGGQLLGTVVGHCVVQASLDSSLFSLPAGGYSGPLGAWAGEPPGLRIQRVCSEEGIQFRAGGDLTTGLPMGVQAQQTVPQLLQEATDAGRGTWHELRQQLGWGYIPPGGLYNQQAAVAVTYAQDMLSEWPADPLEDDKDILNYMTVSQTTGGASATQFAAPGQPVNGGRLSTLVPPNGAGTYDSSVSLNLQRATDLPSMATWLVHSGTVDEPRYPGIVLDLSNRGLASVFYQVLALDLGQRVTIASPPAHLGPDTISQLAQQLDEELWSDTLRIAVTGVPSRPWLIAREGASTGRADTDGSTLASAPSPATTGTTLSVATASGVPLWDTTAFGFDVNVAGERMTVTAISGSSSPQSFTVVRSVNGVVKAQASGAVLALWDTPVAAL